MSDLGGTAVMKKLLALTVSLFFLTGSSFAVPILFDLRDTSATTEIESGTIIRGGVTATLTPFVNGVAGGLLNQTSSSFGINAPGTGDETALIDGTLGIESISMTFSQDILFTGLGLSEFSSRSSGTDIASLTVGTSAPILLIPGIFAFPSSNFVSTGSSVILEWVAYNGISFDLFTIDTDVPSTGTTTGSAASVPESGTTVAFLGLGVFGLILFRRFRC
jgi:hypothetical protein